MTAWRVSLRTPKGSRNIDIEHPDERGASYLARQLVGDFPVESITRLNGTERNMSAQTEIATLEEAWRRANEAQERHSTEATTRAESDAWGRYSAACHDVDQCLQPGCSVTSREHSYCHTHREP